MEPLLVNSPTKTLGLMTSPSGCSHGFFVQIQEKAQGWIDQAIGVKLNRRHIWFLIEHQLFPKVFFGIGSISALFDTLADCLQKQWWEILPCSGVRRTVPRFLRQVNSGFHSIGLPHPGANCLLIMATNLVLASTCRCPWKCSS